MESIVDSAVDSVTDSVADMHLGADDSDSDYVPSSDDSDSDAECADAAKARRCVPPEHQCECFQAILEIFTSADVARVIRLIRQRQFTADELRSAAQVPGIAHATGVPTPPAAAVAAAHGDLSALQFFFGFGGAAPTAATIALGPEAARAYGNSSLYHAARRGREDCVQYLLAATGAQLSRDDATQVLARLQQEDTPDPLWRNAAVRSALETGGVPVPASGSDTDAAMTDA